MTEFKFSCPSCNQHIEVGAEFEGRRIECPSCKAKLTVPAPPKSAGTVPVATRTESAAEPKVGAPTPPKQSPGGAAKTPSKSGSALLATAPAKPRPVTIVPRISDKRVAVLTPNVKLEIVRALRSRLSDKSRWLPGKKGASDYNYSARLEGDKLVPVSPTDASATHHSLFGAVLLEFHRRNILRGTSGRRKFLDEEITEAIHHVLGRQPGDTPMSESERSALTHAQCLAVLDLLEERYKGEDKQAEQRVEEGKIERVRLRDLVSKLEKSSPLRAEEVACALYYELEEINQRLDELEQGADHSDGN